MRRILFVLGLSVLLFPATAHAGSPGPWIGIAGGFGTYAMNDVSKDIDNINVEISPMSMDHIKGGFSAGGEVGYSGPSHIGGSIGYERLFASTDVGDETGSLEYNLHANAFMGSVYWMIPRSERIHVGASVTAGLVSSAGDVRLSVTDVGYVSGDVSGSGPLFGGSLVGELWSASEKAALVVSAGYRYAKIGSVKIAGEKVTNDDGSDYAVDYSGITLRLGARFAFAGARGQ